MVKCQIMVSIKCHLHKRTQVDKGFFLGMVFASLQGYKARQRGQLDMGEYIDPEFNDAVNDAAKKAAKAQKAKVRKAMRREIDAAMRDIGLTKVRGAVSGKIYWE